MRVIEAIKDVICFIWHMEAAMFDLKAGVIIGMIVSIRSCDDATDILSWWIKRCIHNVKQMLMTTYRMAELDDEEVEEAKREFDSFVHMMKEQIV